MKYENPRPVYPNELYHHGIRGQSWGVQNGPPYPLSKAEHRAVIRQQKREAKAERKANKANFKNATRELEMVGYKAYMTKQMADGAARKSARSNAKSYKGEKYSAKASERASNAKATAKEAKFWRDRYNEALNNYRAAAEKAGKKVRYDDSDKSLFKAFNREYNSGGVVGASALGQFTGGILGNIAATAMSAKVGGNRRDAYLDSVRRSAERSAAKAEYKARHAKPTTKQSGSASVQRSATSEKNAIMNEMTRRFGNSEKNKAALADLKNILKTTKGTHDKEFGISTYVTPYGIFDVHYGQNGKIYNVSFDD